MQGFLVGKSMRFSSVNVGIISILRAYIHIYINFGKGFIWELSLWVILWDYIGIILGLYRDYI